MMSSNDAKVKSWKDNMRGSIIVNLIIGVVFIVLQLTNVVSWSWWAITAPFWGFISYWILAATTAALLKGKSNDMVSAFAGLSGIISASVVLAVLRLAGIIDWRWGVVLIPLWVGLGLMALTAFGFAMKHKASDAQKSD